jgi:hypothetical protein
VPATYTPRLSVEITEVQQRRLRQLLPHGLKRAIFSAMVDDLCDLLDSPKREMVIAGILSRDIKAHHVLRGTDNAAR